MLPFASDWGGSYFCFDLSNRLPSGEYPILYWNLEYAEEPDDADTVWSDFAADFMEFVVRVAD